MNWLGSFWQRKKFPNMQKCQENTREPEMIFVFLMDISEQIASLSFFSNYKMDENISAMFCSPSLWTFPGSKPVLWDQLVNSVLQLYLGNKFSLQVLQPKKNVSLENSGRVICNKVCVDSVHFGEGVFKNTVVFNNGASGQNRKRKSVGTFGQNWGRGSVTGWRLPSRQVCSWRSR